MKLHFTAMQLFEAELTINSAERHIANRVCRGHLNGLLTFPKSEKQTFALFARARAAIKQRQKERRRNQRLLDAVLHRGSRAKRRRLDGQSRRSA